MDTKSMNNDAVTTLLDHSTSEDVNPSVEPSSSQSSSQPLTLLNCQKFSITFNQKSGQQTSNTKVNASQSFCDPYQDLERPKKRRRLNDNSMQITDKEHSQHSSSTSVSSTRSFGNGSQLVSGEVFYVGEVYTYIKDGAEQSEFPVVLIDHTHCYRLRVFDVKHHKIFSSSNWVKIDKYRRNDDYIFISSRSDIQKVPTDTVLPSLDVKQKAKRIVEEYEPSEFSEIESVKRKANVRINVKGQIVQVSEAEEGKLNSEQRIAFRKIQIRDNTGTICVTLWREKAKTSLKNGEMLVIKKALVQLKNDDLWCLSVQSYTQIEVLPSDDQPIVGQIIETEETPLIGEIEGIGKVYQYKACARCNYRKLDDYKCTKCGIRYNSRTACSGITCQLSMRVGERYILCKVFTQEVKKLLHFIHPSENTDNMLESNDVEDKIVEELPCTVTYTVNNKNVLTIVEFVKT